MAKLVSNLWKTDDILLFIFLGLISRLTSRPSIYVSRVRNTLLAIKFVIYRSLTRVLIVDLIRRLIYIHTAGPTAICHSSEDGCFAIWTLTGPSSSSNFLGFKPCSDRTFLHWY
jgi:hypothetical protein